MQILHIRANIAFTESGHLPPISLYADKQYLTTTAFLHFSYEDIEQDHYLRELTLFCLPNGLLQHLYNPTHEDPIWLAGRNAPTLGEDFRVRVSFARLKAKAHWRVQRIRYNRMEQICEGEWDE